jgi:hypothetical protein
MTHMQRYSIFFIALILCALFAIRSAARAQSMTRVSWSDLSFHAKHLLVEVSTDIQLRSLRASDLDAVLLKSPKGNPIRVMTPEPAQITINTTITPRLRSPVNIYNRIWFNPADASALGRIRLRRGEDDFKKNYRFTDQGVFRHRIEPRNKKETSLDPEKWTDVKDSFYPYNQARLGCSGVSERSLLIYILSTGAFSRNYDSLSLCVFGKRQLHRVQLRKEGTQPIQFNYIEKSHQVVTRRKEGAMKALKVDITAEPIDSGQEVAETFSLLGFHKNISIYIHPTTGLPIQISGFIPSIGKAELKLNSVQLNHPSN